MRGSAAPPPRWGPFSVSRSLEVLAAIAVVLIVAGTAHRLYASRVLIMSDAAQQDPTGNGRR